VLLNATSASVDSVEILPIIVATESSDGKMRILDQLSGIRIYTFARSTLLHGACPGIAEACGGPQAAGFIRAIASGPDQTRHHIHPVAPRENLSQCIGIQAEVEGQQPFGDTAKIGRRRQVAVLEQLARS
jgi:hypothetical protein